MMVPSYSTAKPIIVSSAPDGHYGHRNLFNDYVYIYVVFLARSWMMHPCYSAAYRHLGITRTRKTLEHFFWWVTMEVSTEWWVRRCLNFRNFSHQTFHWLPLCILLPKINFRNFSHQTFHWLPLCILLPKIPRISVRVDYIGSLPVTAQRNHYILLFTDRSSRRSNMFHVAAAEYTVEGTANSLVNLLVPLWGCLSNLLSDNGL